MTPRSRRHLYVGHLKRGQTSLMRLNALRRHGLEIEGLDVRSIWDRQGWIARRVAWNLERGAAIDAMNDAVLVTAEEQRPDVVWFDKQEFIRPATLARLKERGAKLIYYTPDPYFAVDWKQTSFTRTSMPLFDVLVTAKAYELDKFRALGGHVIYMPLGYCDEVHRPAPDVRDEEIVDVGFVGGWEPRRETFIEALAADGRSVRIWGYGWDHLIDGKWTLRRRMRLSRLTPGERPRIRRSDHLADHIEPAEVYDTAYAQALTQSAISLGLLRTIYPDQHTTRTFEIPACESMMLADRTDEHLSFFEEGKEAEFFSSTEELLDKARFYSERPDARRAVARAGRERCERSGYSYFERFRPMLAELEAVV